MAFSFFEKILSILPSVLLPGPIGTGLTASLASGFGAPGAQPTRLVSNTGQSVGPQFASSTMLARIPRGLLTGPVAATGVGVLSEILLRAKEATGRRVTKRDIIHAAKHCGIELAAETFGISTMDVCQIVAAGAPRRRRGISAADLRRTRSTIRKVNTIRKDLKLLSR